MKYLAVDTSGKSLTVLVQKDNERFIYHDESCQFRHSVELMPKIEETLEKAKLSIGEIDFFASVVGAGSFTGIRIGVSTIKAFCLAFNKPALSITSFDTIAYNRKGGRVLAVIDAKHDAFYVCGYDDYKVCYQPSYVDKDTLLGIIKDYDEVLSFEEIEGITTSIVSIKDGLINAIEGKYHLVQDANLLEPLYVRKSQAEEGR